MTARPSAYTVAGSSHQNPSGDAAWIAPTTTPHPAAVRIGLFFAGRLTRDSTGLRSGSPRTCVAWRVRAIRDRRRSDPRQPLPVMLRGAKMQHHVPTGTGNFPRDVDGLPAATRTPDLVLSDGDELDLRIGPVANRIGDAVVRMLAYNGSIPGPTLRVAQGS